jgi:hypothetical protein
VRGAVWYLIVGSVFDSPSLIGFVPWDIVTNPNDLRLDTTTMTRMDR